jgi:hypothetical protein
MSLKSTQNCSLLTQGETYQAALMLIYGRLCHAEQKYVDGRACAGHRASRATLSHRVTGMGWRSS